MKTREHSSQPASQPPQPAGNGGSDSELDAIRQSAEAMLAAGDAAINNALSTNSAQFIQQARQEGGE